MCFSKVGGVVQPLPQVPAKRLYYALRKRRGKTVMLLDNFWGALPAEAASQPSPGRQPSDLDHLFSVAYEELRRLASSVRRGDPGATLSPTALVNEAWMKLANSPGVAAESEAHFKRIAARAMRQLLIEAARRRHAGKRGGDAVVVAFDESLEYGAACAKDLLALDAALDELARIHPRQAMMVESRFFGGMEIAEIAAQLGISEATVLRDWRAAKAWLAVELRRPR